MRRRRIQRSSSRERRDSKGSTGSRSSPGGEGVRYEVREGARVQAQAQCDAGYIATHVVKAVTGKVGKFGRKAFAQAMKNVKLSTMEYARMLMDVAYHDQGDIDRERYLVEVEDGKQILTETLPRLKP
jgi:hypothetical protein